MTTPKGFEDWLREVHAKDYHGTDDDMPDAFDLWICEEQSPNDWIKYADEWHNALMAEKDEKIDILEEERTEWWSKAKCPDECYIPIKEHVRLRDEKEKEIESFESLLNSAYKEIERLKRVPTVEEIRKIIHDNWGLISELDLAVVILNLINEKKDEEGSEFYKEYEKQRNMRGNP